MTVKDCRICFEPEILDEWKTFTPDQIRSIINAFRLCKKDKEICNELVLKREFEMGVA